MAFDSRQRGKEQDDSKVSQPKAASQIIDKRAITATRQHQQSLMLSRAAQQSLAASVASSQVQRKKNNTDLLLSSASPELSTASQGLNAEGKKSDIFFGGVNEQSPHAETPLKKSLAGSAGAPVQMTKWKFTHGFWQVIQTTNRDSNTFANPNTFGAANEGDEYDQDTGEYTPASENREDKYQYDSFGYFTEEGTDAFDIGIEEPNQPEVKEWKQPFGGFEEGNLVPDQDEVYPYLESTQDEDMTDKYIEQVGFDMPGDLKEPPKSLSDEKQNTKKRKRSEMSSNSDSELSESEDDDLVSLTSEQKLKIMIKKGKHKKRKLLESAIERKQQGLTLNDPRHRKVFSAHRSNATKESMLISDINKQEYFRLGSQNIRLGDGRGHFIQPGGNEDRPKNIKEPSADYHDFFEELKLLGKDENAAKLFKLITGSELGDKSNLTDAEIAIMLLYYMNNDAGTITEALGSRSQLTEHMSKFTAISCLSEFMRGFEATENKSEAPYDTTLLIKQGLTCVASGSCTLQDVFYKGQGGKESFFLGAPSGIKAPDKIGGAVYLRDPLNPDYKPHLDRQMGLFPDNKGEFKKKINSYKSNTNVPLPQLSDEARQQMEVRHKAEQVQNANNLLMRAGELQVPNHIAELNDFLNGSSKNSFLRKYRDEAKKLRKQYKNNEDALAVLKQVDLTLNQKAKKAKAILFK